MLLQRSAVLAPSRSKEGEHLDRGVLTRVLSSGIFTSSCCIGRNPEPHSTLRTRQRVAPTSRRSGLFNAINATQVIRL